MTDYTNYQAVTNQDGDELIPVNYHERRDQPLARREEHEQPTGETLVVAEPAKPLLDEKDENLDNSSELQNLLSAQDNTAAEAATESSAANSSQDQSTTAAADVLRHKLEQLKADATALPEHKELVIQPLAQPEPATSAAPQAPKATADTQPAIEVAIHPIAQPVKPAVTEAKPLAAAVVSKHQAYMQQLRSSGKSMAEIQTAWHDYYNTLSDIEKHEVWREFYDTSAPKPQASRPTNAAGQPVATGAGAVFKPTAAAVHPGAPAGQHPGVAPQQGALGHNPLAVRSIAEPTQQQQHLPPAVKAELLRNINKRSRLRPKQHFQSLLFGLGCGAIAVIVVLFSFFNEVIIAPFIQPSRTVNDTPIIIGANGVAPTDKPEVIIPKINVEIPLDYSVKGINENDIQNGLENGVVHYPTTPLPGQQGNTAFFGHSSNNIFNKGKYKFAFVLLHELVPGDTFYLTNNGVAYGYQVIDKKIVDPSNVSILDPIAGKAATATLITCDPPGTTLHRLVVIGEQVSPAPAANTPGTIQKAAESGVKTLPDNGPSLWARFKSWITSH